MIRRHKIGSDININIVDVVIYMYRKILIYSSRCCRLQYKLVSRLSYRIDKNFDNEKKIHLL